jgi:hypothetical protein
MSRLQDDPDLRAKVMLHWRHNPVDWINDNCLTFDPRLEDARLVPFNLFPRQVEMIHFLQDCLADRQRGLIEKCRDAGASYVCSAYTIWLWLFSPGSVIGWGSRIEEDVDKIGNPKAIFPKMRQMMEYLPGWMMPAGFIPKVHSTHLKIVNPENGAAIIGQGGDNQGRGGRTTCYFKDEAAWYDHPELIEAALSANTQVQIDVSSVNGAGNVFYRRRMSGEIWEPGKIIPRGKTRVFIFDWRDDPRKSQEWYDETKLQWANEGLPHIFAQEVDRDYSGSQERIIIPNTWVRAAIDAHVKLGFSGTGERIAGQDIADGGGDKNAIAIRHGVILQHVQHWGGEAGDAPAVAIPLCREHRVQELFYDSIGVGAGFKAGANTLKAQGAVPATLKILPWNAAASPQDPDKYVIPGDKGSLTNDEMYANLKAQAWFRLRARFSKTYNAITKGEAHDPEDLISLPSDMPGLHELVMELSQATHKYSGSGKTVVDKSPDGARSPNLADAVVMCFNPVRKARGVFDLL